MTTLRAREALPGGKFDALHYRRVHCHLFQDVYGWAGKYRTVRTGKGGNLFCLPDFIASEMNRTFATIPPPIEANDADALVTAAARFLADLNAIHPFREGNGRSQLSFTAMLGERANYPLDFARIRQSTFLPAMIASFAGENEPPISELRLMLH